MNIIYLDYNNDLSYLVFMNIKEHIKTTGLTQKMYADSVGISRMSLHRILNGQAPGQKMAHKFVKFSGGQITFDEIYGRNN